MARIFSRVRSNRSGELGESTPTSKLAGCGASRSSSCSSTRRLASGSTRSQLLFAHQADGVFDQLADHALDVAAVVADFGVLGGLDLDERCAGERRQPAGDLGFADAGRADHENVFGRDLVAHIVLELLPPPAIADGDGDGSLGIILADDVAVEFGDDLAGSQLAHCETLFIHHGDAESTENGPKQILIRRWTQIYADTKPISYF